MHWTARHYSTTAEGSHKEIENVLQRMREIAVQVSKRYQQQSGPPNNLQAEMNAMSHRD